MDITMMQIAAAEVAINFALIVANISTHIRAKRLLKSADEIWREAIAYRTQAEQILEDAKAYRVRK